MAFEIPLGEELVNRREEAKYVNGIYSICGPK